MTEMNEFMMCSQQHIKKQRHRFASKGPYSQSYVTWTIKKAKRQRIDGFQTVVLEKTF